MRQNNDPIASQALRLGNRYSYSRSPSHQQNGDPKRYFIPIVSLQHVAVSARALKNASQTREHRVNRTAVQLSPCTQPMHRAVLQAKERRLTLCTALYLGGPRPQSRGVDIGGFSCLPSCPPPPRPQIYKCWHNRELNWKPNP